MATQFMPAKARVALTIAVVGVLVLALGLLLAGCGGGSTATTATTVPGGGTTTTVSGGSTTTGGETTTSGQSGGGTEVRVIMTDIAYDPETVTVKVGDTVTWVNEDPLDHDVIADNGEFESGLFGGGESFSFTFTTAGTYPYHCSVHPGMDGTVVVK